MTLSMYVSSPPQSSGVAGRKNAHSATRFLSRLSQLEHEQECRIPIPSAGWGTSGHLLLWWDNEDRHVEVEFTDGPIEVSAWWSGCEDHQQISDAVLAADLVMIKLVFARMVALR